MTPTFKHWPPILSLLVRAVAVLISPPLVNAEVSGAEGVSAEGGGVPGRLPLARLLAGPPPLMLSVSASTQIIHVYRRTFLATTTKCMYLCAHSKILLMSAATEHF